LPDTLATSAHAAAASAAVTELDRLLAADAPAIRDTLPPRFADAAAAFVRLLLEANERLNLTRVVEPEAVARLHLLDAVSALPIIDERPAARAVDLGSGGGVPGIVMAIARPAVRWALVDSVRKKADALTAMLADLDIGGVDVAAERAEDLGRDPAWRDAADLVTARACAPLPVLVEYALPLLRPGGRLVAWKGPLADGELEAGTTASVLVGGAPPEVRGTGIAALGDHRFVLVEKVEPTPSRYPRRPGEPSRRPLGG
jgi:16S rRNA (guanine527-N7)-methyltransferase